MTPAASPDADAVLGVARSVLGRRWTRRLAAASEPAARDIAQRMGLPEIMGAVLASRGVEPEQAAAHLEPRLRTHMPDPARFAGMAAAVERTCAAVRRGEGIGVFGDYDVDGATSAALLLTYFAALGTPAQVHIPDRRREGYGPNAPALLDLQARGCALVLTVDCGTQAHEALETAARAGLDVVVLDHHQPGASLPPCVAVVNPRRADDHSGQDTLAAAGVTFVFLCALHRALEQAGHFADIAPPPLLDLLDLVALGTICDVVPLAGFNRALVAQGLRVMSRRRNVGLDALARVADIRGEVSAYHAGFILGPRINAGGRVGQANLGVRLLVSGDSDEAYVLARRLDQHNRERQEIETQVLAQALDQAAEQAAAPGCRLVVACGRDWHPGVVGLVASRLKTRYGLPAFAISLDSGGGGKGSGRSVPGFDMGAQVLMAQAEGVPVRGGGHPMAAGMTLAPGGLDSFCEFMRQRAVQALPGGPDRRLALDGVLSPAAARRDLCDLVSGAGPFGAGNPEPRFALASACVSGAGVVGQGHVRCVLTAAGRGPRIRAIAFRAAPTPLGQVLMECDGAPLHLAGTLRPDTYTGRNDVQFHIEDAASPPQGPRKGLPGGDGGIMRGGQRPSSIG